jgi:hypothetical protein
MVPALRKNLMHKSDGPREGDDYLGDDEDTNQPRIKFQPLLECKRLLNEKRWSIDLIFDPGPEFHRVDVK